MGTWLQINDGDLIGASAGAFAALLDARMNCACLETAMFTLNVFMRVYHVLDAATSQPGINAAITAAGWKRCREVRFLQKLAMVRLLPCVEVRWHHAMI